MMKRLLAATLGLVMLAGATDARADDTVKLSTPTPWHRWCVQPLCANGSPPPLLPPPATFESGLGGYAEARLRAAAAEQIDAWVKEHAAEWNTKPIRDLARTAVAALSDDADKLKRTQGLAASLVRVGMVLKFEAVLPKAEGCQGAPRRDAIYEGLAISRSLGALAFPESDHTVLASCKATAEKTARSIDAELIRLLDRSEPLLTAAKSLRRDVQRAHDACSQVPAVDPAASSATVKSLSAAKARPTFSALARVLTAAKQDKAAAASWSGPAEACATAVIRLAGVDAVPFASSLAEAVGDVDVDQLIVELAESVLSCESQACEGALELLQVAHKGVDEQMLRALVTMVRERLGLDVLDTSAFAGVLRALDESVVAVGKAASIEPKAFVQAVARQYGLDEDGNFTLVGLIKPGPLVLEANAGVPRLRGDDTKIVGDLTLGWKTKSLGIVVNGSIGYYDFVAANGSTDSTRARGALEAWWRSGEASSTVRLELRAIGGVDYYDSSYVPKQGATNAGFFHDEDSTLARGALMLGVRIEPSQRLLASVLVGGGIQYESYGYLGTDPKDPNLLFDSTALTGRSQARMLLRWRVLPQFVALRARAEASMFQLTRDIFTVAQIGRPLAVTSTTTSISQLEVSVRSFIDLELARFFGVVPAAWAGFDMVSAKDSAGEVRTTVPVFGVGLVRPSF